MGKEEYYIETSKCEVFGPNGKDFCVEKNECEKRVNLCVDKRKNIFIHGYIIDYRERPVKDVVVRLFQYKDQNYLKSVSHTFTDCNGYYEFNLGGDYEGRYHISVSDYSDRKKKSYGDLPSYDDYDYDMDYGYEDDELCQCEYCRARRKSKRNDICKVNYCY